jgi:hypothetical protein
MSWPIFFLVCFLIGVTLSVVRAGAKIDHVAPRQRRDVAE